MYCIQCGVKLADSEKQCPLCQTAVFHPDLPRPAGEPLYPRDKYPHNPYASKTPQIIMAMLYLLPILIVLLCDVQINGEVTWCGYVIGALLVSYSWLGLPYWFRNPNPAVFLPCGFAAVICYLLYINYAVDGNWFLTFAFPVAGGVGVLVTGLVVLLRWLPRGKLYIAGGFFLCFGGFMVLTEYLLNLTFEIPRALGWSLYPLVVLGLLGCLLIYLAINRNAREMMERKFFI